jgi:hypothetical protein
MRNKNRFKLISSKGNDGVLSFLKKHTKKLASSEALRVSKKLLKTIEKTNQEIEKNGIPSNLYLAHVHKQVQFGIFLKPDSACIEVGEFIGTYTGRYELVEVDTTKETAYAYDVLQGFHLPKKSHCYVKDRKKSYPKNQEFAIQTNALKEGNFTRFINHSSLAPNVEAVVSKMPDGRMEILLFALKKIRPGEQLLSNYGGQYWAALGIIPNDMTPSSYKLDTSYKVIKHRLPPAISPKTKKHLMTLRHPILTVSPSLEKDPNFKRIRAMFPSLTSSLRKKIEAMEETILERGIPRQFDLKKIKGKWQVLLRKDSHSIQKNTFIGSFSGLLLLKNKANRTMFLSLCKVTNTKTLYIDLKDASFTKHVLTTLTEGNLSMKIFHDKEDEKLTVVLFAKRKISPGESIFFNPVKNNSETSYPPL